MELALWEGRRMDEKYLTVEEVRTKLNVTRQAVYNWISEGKLRAVRVGRSVRVPVSALVEFIQPIKPGERIEDEEAPGQLA
jgi:excisionase family DNA binding protein